MVEKYSEIRNELKDIANSSKTSLKKKMEARRKLDLLPKIQVQYVLKMMSAT